MLTGAVLVVLQLGTVAQATPVCPEIPAKAVIQRLSELPSDIRENLLHTYKDMGERGSPLLETDAPSVVEQAYPTSRFMQAVLIKNVWYVQFEVSLFAGVRTQGYIRGSDGRYQISPTHYYGGPACETLKAAFNGVVNPGRPE